jgi:hypothetical protein
MIFGMHKKKMKSSAPADAKSAESAAAAGQEMRVNPSSGEPGTIRFTTTRMRG